jgi:hypothetical protein
MAFFSKAAPAPVRTAAICVHGEENCVRCGVDDHEHTVQLYFNLPLVDLENCIRALPYNVRQHLLENTGVTVAGGFIRSIITGESVQDIDIFYGSGSIDNVMPEMFNFDAIKYPSKAETLDTRTGYVFDEDVDRVEVQLIKRWKFKNPAELLEVFDLTIARAAIWYDGAKWQGICHKDYYRDLAAKRLVYEDRTELRSYGILRVLKFVQRGYHIDATNLAKVLADLVADVQSNINIKTVRTTLEDKFNKAIRLVDMKTLSEKKKKETDYYSGS